VAVQKQRSVKTCEDVWGETNCESYFYHCSIWWLLRATIILCIENLM